MDPDQQIRKLGSEKLGEIAYQLWNGYLQVAAIIQSNQNSSLLHNQRIINSVEKICSQQDATFQARSISFKLKNNLSKPLVLSPFSYSPYL